MMKSLKRAYMRFLVSRQRAAREKISRMNIYTTV